MKTVFRVVFVLFLALTRLLTAKGTDREFLGRVVYGQVLEIAPFQRFYTAGELECAHRCLTQAKCVSFDYNSTGKGRGLCRLNDKSTRLRFPAKGNLPPEHDSNYIVVEKFITKPKSCLGHYINGERTSGLYEIYDSEGEHYKVFCDLTSEEGSVWTLVMSQSYKNRNLRQLKNDGLVANKTLNTDKPNWSAYRVSRSRMIDLQSQATHWRVTCSFPLCGVDYRDYTRARFSQFDPLSFKGNQKCERVEYINIRGHNCTDCTAPWSQETWQMLHHRSDLGTCELGKVPGAVRNEQCFGYYNNHNPLFRCTATNDSSTNHWFGAYV